MANPSQNLQTYLAENNVQYIRSFSLLVSGNKGQTLNLSELRVKFSIKLNTAQTPNAASIRVYNISRETAVQVQSQFHSVTIWGGYSGNYGVIYKGNIKQVILGRESATDTFMDIIAGDGDLAYNFAVVSTNVPAGSSQQAQINAAVTSMTPLGTTNGGNTSVSSQVKLPRGKVLFGNARNYLRSVAKTNQYDWFIQQGQVVFVKKKGYLPGSPLVINSQNGMIGTPQQTTEGVNVKTLLTPLALISMRIQLDNKTVARLRVDLTLTPGPSTNLTAAAPLPSNGIYSVFAIEHSGDTRGIDWYTTFICTQGQVLQNG